MTKAITHLLQDISVQVRGTGPISFHLGCNFVRDEDGAMQIFPKEVIKKLLGSYECIVSSNPSRMSPLLWKREIILNWICSKSWILKASRTTSCLSVLSSGQYPLAG